MMKKWLVLPALLLLSSCYSNEQVFDYSKVLFKNEIIEGLKIGDKIVVEPKTLTYEGESKIVDGQIIFPNGTTKVGKSFIIEMPGIYEVKYRAFFDTHEEVVSLFYHCHRTSGDFFISNNKDNPAQTGVYSHPISDNTIQGAKLILDTKTTFTFDGEIDFNSFDPNKSFIDFVIDTSKRETSDIESFTIRLTDVEDNNNYVDITVTDSGPIDDDGRGSYWLAGSNSQFKTGYEGGKNSTLWISKYGTNVGMSFRDLPEKSAKLAKLYFNYAEKELYVSPRINTDLKTIITDLDDKNIYGSTIWEGFKSGKATVSIFANSLLSNNATLIVSKIANIDLSPLDFVDTDAPIIKINYKGQSTINVPMATVNKPYKIYEAIVSDNYDRHLPYSTYVTYFDETHNINRDITITDGYFTPKEAGEYTITYIAKDHSNNYAEKTVDIIAVNDSQEMTITLDESVINQELYSTVKLPSINEVKTKISGGSGRPALERFVFDTEGYPLEIEGDSFVPINVGEYVVVYHATDYIDNEAVATLTVNVTDPGHPVFIEEFNLPKILIKGHKYTLPTYLGAEVINNQTTYLSSKVYVNDVLLEEGTFIADDNCEIKYQLSGETGEEVFLTSIDVVDVGNPINPGNYFYGELDVETHDEDVTLSASNGDVSTIFASVLPYDNLLVKFAFTESSFNCDELVFRFSDSSNYNNSLSFHISVNNEKTYISLGGDETKYEFAGFEENNSKSYSIDFNPSTRALKDIYRKDIATAKYNDQGNLFTGVKDGVYLEIYMNGVKDETSFKMLAISNQVLGYFGDPADYIDFIEPMIILKEDFITEQNYDTDAFIPTAVAFDVLSDFTIKVSVRAPDGTYAIRNEDARIHHSFKLNQFGKYIVTYSSIDSESNSATYRVSITVYDFVPPELTINGSLGEVYGINSAITIPTYSISDNLNNYYVDVFLIMPDNEERLLLEDTNGVVVSYLTKDNMYYNSSFKVDDRTFRAEQYGHYTLRFVAYDSDFNKVVKELHFEVK